MTKSTCDKLIKMLFNVYVASGVMTAAIAVYFVVWRCIAMNGIKPHMHEAWIIAFLCSAGMFYALLPVLIHLINKRRDCE